MFPKIISPARSKNKNQKKKAEFLYLKYHLSGVKKKTEEKGRVFVLLIKN